MIISQYGEIPGYFFVTHLYYQFVTINTDNTKQALAAEVWNTVSQNKIVANSSL